MPYELSVANLDRVYNRILTQAATFKARFTKNNTVLSLKESTQSHQYKDNYSKTHWESFTKTLLPYSLDIKVTLRVNLKLDMRDNSTSIS